MKFHLLLNIIMQKLQFFLTLRLISFEVHSTGIRGFSKLHTIHYQGIIFNRSFPPLFIEYNFYGNNNTGEVKGILFFSEGTSVGSQLINVCPNF